MPVQNTDEVQIWIRRTWDATVTPPGFAIEINGIVFRQTATGITRYQVDADPDVYAGMSPGDQNSLKGMLTAIVNRLQAKVTVP